MLRGTFLHLPSVGEITEWALWEGGVTRWGQLSVSAGLPSRIRSRHGELRESLDESEARLSEHDSAFFAARLPGSQRWRLYADFREQAAFVDIETTGLSPESSFPTVVGILDHDGYRAFVHGENFDVLPEVLTRYRLLVTYNGAAFDLPFLAYHFRREGLAELLSGIAHLDLLFPLRRLGYRGGLKAVERLAGLERNADLDGLGGFDAVRMWRMWERGDHGARNTLVRYNAEDVASLPFLADLVYNKMAGRLPVDWEYVRPLDYPAIELPYDVDLAARLKGTRWRPWVT